MGDTSSRRTSLRNSRVSESLNPNVFADDYAEDSNSDLDIPVQDGFRPSGGRRSARLSQGDSDITRNRSPQPPSPTPSTPGPSDTKQNPFESTAPPTKGRVGEIRANATGSSYAPSLHRSSSSASSFATSTGGPSGPSHPYAMYPQGTNVGRTSSVMSTSTVRSPQRAYSQRTRPAHPYTMYNQNIFDGQRNEAGIPVGFPGHGQEIHRQIGPDGEELDIIGIDGHTEQLPPYSRYPEGEDPFKDPPVVSPRHRGESSANESSHQTLINEPEVRAHRVPSQDESSPSATLLGGSREGSLKEMNEKSWKERSKKRICWGKMPLWLAALLAVGAVLLLGGILGGVLGSLVTKEHFEAHPPPPPHGPPNANPFHDYISPTQTDIRPAPTGSYAVVLENPAESEQGCLFDQNQFDSWQCDVTGPPVIMDINYSPQESLFDVVVHPPVGINGTYYGSVPPNFKVPTLKLVQDLDDPQKRPALHFEAAYDKMVIVPSDLLQATNAGNPVARPQTATGPMVQPGDTPWLCYWNDTWIEGFIYEENSTYSSYSSVVRPPTMTATTTVATATVSTTVNPSGITYAQGGLATPNNTPKSEGEPAESDDDSHETYQEDRKRRRVVNLHPQLMSKLGRRFRYPYSTTAPFPRVLKMEERRFPDPDNPPYCQQHRFHVNQTFTPLGAFVRLGQTDPPPRPEGGYKGRRGLALFYQAQTEEPSNSCHCQWIDA